MEDKHIRLTQIGELSEKDAHGVFSAGYSYINPNNILYLEEIRKTEEWTTEKLIETYKKDPELKDICWWGLKHYMYGRDGWTDTPEKLLLYWQDNLDQAKAGSNLYRKETVTARHTRVHLITGKTFIAKENPELVKDMISNFFKKEEESNKDRIIVTKDDIIKNFIFKNLT